MIQDAVERLNSNEEASNGFKKIRKGEDGLECTMIVTSS